MKCDARLHFYLDVPRRGSEGCNHSAHQRALLQPHCSLTWLLYRCLPHQFNYGFLQMQINGESANVNVAVYALHELYNSIIEQQDINSHTSYNFKFQTTWLVWNTENLVEAIQTTKPKHVDHITMFTCLYRRSSERVRRASKTNHLITSQPQYQHHHTNKYKQQITLERPQTRRLGIYRFTTDRDSSTVSSLFHIH